MIMDKDDPLQGITSKEKLGRDNGVHQSIDAVSANGRYAKVYREIT
jgi:hypothetical protein